MGLHNFDLKSPFSGAICLVHIDRLGIIVKFSVFVVCVSFYFYWLFLSSEEELPTPSAMEEKVRSKYIVYEYNT